MDCFCNYFLIENEEYEEEDKVENNKEMFDSLATLAEVSLATAGKLEADQSLKRKIDQARAKITSNSKNNKKSSHPAVTTKTILPITPEMSSKRTMQVRFQFYSYDFSTTFDMPFQLASSPYYSLLFVAVC